MQITEHTKDSDCTVDPNTGLCQICGVEQSEPCPACGCTSFHAPTCEICPDPGSMTEEEAQRIAEQMLADGCQ